MPVPLDDRARDLIDRSRHFVLTTLGAGGAPQTTVVFALRDGHTVLVSTIRGRVKTRNMQRDPRVSLLALAASDGRWVQVRGRVEITEDPGRELLHTMYDRFVDGPPPPEPGAERLVVRIVPDSVFTFPPAPDAA